MFLNAGDEVFDDAEFDISFEEGKADVAEGVGDVLFGDFSDTPEVPESFVEAVSEIGKHGVTIVRRTGTARVRRGRFEI